MLKFLTHKLRTHSLNEDNPHHKVEDEDHDSGTESDDEHGTSDEPEISMESEGWSVVTALSRSRSSLLTPASPFQDSAFPSDCDQGYDQHSSEEELEVINRAQPKHSTGQEKRKWSQVTPEMGAGHRRSSLLHTRTETSSSSDEDVRATPVQFITSPPSGTHRPAQIFLQEASPRKRHKNIAPPRPCLDFEKMQQVRLKARAWRHGGETGTGELPVYCW